MDHLNAVAAAVTPASGNRKVARELALLQSGGANGRRNGDSGWNLCNTVSQSNAETPTVKRKRKPTAKCLELERSRKRLPKPSTISVLPAETTEKKGPPRPARSIIENEALSECVEAACICSSCKKGQIKLSFPSVCIATAPTLQCTNCSKVSRCDIATADVFDGNQKKTNHTRNSDFAVNMQYGLAFVASGDGGCEAQKLLGFLDLPNATTMEKKSFSKLERTMAVHVMAVTKKFMEKNLIREVKLTAEDPTTSYTVSQFHKWHDSLSNDGDLPVEDFPSLTVSMDMGWNGRGSGKAYNSSSGFACLVGMYTRKVILNDLKNRYCKVCSLRQNAVKTTTVPEHYCPVNHDGSSGAMEPAALVDMAHRLYDEFKVTLKFIVTDDDSSMKSQMRWNNKDFMNHHKLTRVPSEKSSTGSIVKRTNNGRLRYPIPEPIFLADPGHRKKSLKGRMYKLKAKTLDKRLDISDVDILRVSTNFCYMTNCLPTIDKSKWQSASKAVVEHHFGNHQFCGDFCNYKDLSDEEVEESGKYFRDKIRDKLLYDWLTEQVGDFTTPEMLEEVGHGMDSNVNEALNNIVAWLAPKNKTYSGTVALENRIHIAIGIHLAGFEDFFTSVFEAMSIDMTAGVAYYLSMQQKQRNRRTMRSKTSEWKKKRRLTNYKKLREATMKLRKSKEKGQYKPGVGAVAMVAVITEESTKICSACKQIGHLRPTNKLCRFYQPRKKKTSLPKEVPESTCAGKTKVIFKDLERDGEEQAMLDTIDFDIPGDITAAHLNSVMDDEEDCIDIAENEENNY